MSVYDPESLSALWECAPSAGVAGAAGRIGAAIWQGSAREIWGPPDAAMTVVGMSLADYNVECIKDGRIAYAGHWRSGQIQIMPAGVEPRCILPGDWRLLQVYVPTSLLRETMGQGASGGLDLIDPLGEPDPQLQRLLLAVAAELQFDHGPQRIAIDGLGLALASHMLTRWRGSEARPAPAGRTLNARDWRLRRAIEYLRFNLSEDVGLAEVAEVVGLTTTHLTALFKRGTGITPHRWLMQQRFERACQLLGREDQSITDIAYACGFASSQHLAAVFQKRLGLSPRQFRQRRLS